MPVLSPLPLPARAPPLPLYCRLIVITRGQAEHVPLEDELEALCRLHAARAELILSGDEETFLLGVGPLVEAHAFREDEVEISWQ